MPAARLHQPLRGLLTLVDLVEVGSTVSRLASGCERCGCRARGRPRPTARAGRRARRARPRLPPRASSSLTNPTAGTPCFFRAARMAAVPRCAAGSSRPRRDDHGRSSMVMAIVRAGGAVAARPAATRRRPGSEERAGRSASRHATRHRRRLQNRHCRWTARSRRSARMLTATGTAARPLALVQLVHQPTHAGAGARADAGIHGVGRRLRRGVAQVVAVGRRARR